MDETLKDLAYALLKSRRGYEMELWCLHCDCCDRNGRLEYGPEKVIRMCPTLWEAIRAWSRKGHEERERDYAESCASIGRVAVPSPAPNWGHLYSVPVKPFAEVPVA